MVRDTTTATSNKLESCYNKRPKNFYGHKRSDSVTKMLLDLGIPSFRTVILNCRFHTCSQPVIALSSQLCAI